MTRSAFLDFCGMVRQQAGPITDAQVEQAVDLLNKMEKIYAEGTTVNIDNRKIEIIVTTENAKQLTEKIIDGQGTEKEV